MKRFGVITGETQTEWMSYRLAVVYNKRPDFVIRGVTPSVAVSVSTSVHTDGNEDGSGVGSVRGSGGGSGSNGLSDENDSNQQDNHNNRRNNNNNHSNSTNNNQNHDREKDKVKRPPSIWEKIIEKYRWADAVNYTRNREIMSDKFENRFPQVGIQRSVTAATSAEGIR